MVGVVVMAKRSRGVYVCVHVTMYTIERVYGLILWCVWRHTVLYSCVWLLLLRISNKALSLGSYQQYVHSDIYDAGMLAAVLNERTNWNSIEIESVLHAPNEKKTKPVLIASWQRNIGGRKRAIERQNQVKSALFYFVRWAEQSSEIKTRTKIKSTYYVKWELGRVWRSRNNN